MAVTGSICTTTSPTRNSVARLLRPRSVAIVGASPSPGSLGGNVFGNLQRFSYSGEIYLVNPKRPEIDGRRCLGSIEELPTGVDCAVIAVPRTGVLEAVTSCAKRGVGGIIIYSAGFSEAGPEGRALQEQIAQIAYMHNMAIEGPNCVGMVNFVDGVPLTFSLGVAPFPRDNQAGAALLSQSGAMATVLRTHFCERDIRISYSISTGNEAVTGIEDFLDCLVDDAAVNALIMIAEQFRDPKRFLNLVRCARKGGKAVVLLHPGRSAAARISAQTHTGAMTGDYQVMRALVENEGVIIVDSLDELVDVTEMVMRCRSLPQGGVAVITESGTHKGLLLDFAESVGLALPPPSAITETALRAVLPDFIPPTNPLDTTAQALVDPTLFTKTMKPLLADERYGTLLVSAILNSVEMSKSRLRVIIDAVKELRPSKAVLFALLGATAAVPQEMIAELRALGVPFFDSPDRTIRAVARITAARAPRPPRHPPMTIASGNALPRGIVPEYLSKRILQQAGIAVPAGELASDLDSAKAAAARIGYPVALKAQSAALPHKSDVGGVVLRIADTEALAAGWAKLHADIAQAQPGLVLDGVLVEAMAPAGLELILGARHDRDWGPVLVVGLGGVWAEALRDFRVLSPDLAPEAIVDELRKLKGAALLDGFRSSPPLDVGAMGELTSRLGALIVGRPEIREVDINPVLLGTRGHGAIALDALIVTES